MSDARPDIWRTYLTLSLVIFGGFVAFGSAGPFQSLYAVSLGASLGQVALVAGANVTVGPFASLFWGRVADDPRRRAPMLAAALGSMALVLLAEASVSRLGADALPSLVAPWMLLVPLRFMEGAVWPASQVASMAMMGDLLAGDARRPRLVSAYRMTGSLAFGVAIVVSGSVSQAFGYAGSLVVASGVLGAAMLAALTLPSSTGATPPSAAGTPARARPLPLREVASGPMRPVLLLAIAFGLPFSMVYGTWPIWVANDRGFGQAAYSQLWGLAAFVEVPCMLVAGWLIGRIGSARTFAIGLATFAVVYAAYVAAPTLPVLFAVQALRGFGFAAYAATSLTMAIEMAPPSARGRASGLYQSAQGFAQIAGSWFGPPLAQAVGFPPVFAIASIAVAAGAAYAIHASSRPGLAPPSRT